ncbi:MAG: murein DD-endopeptidase / murein LD-carboxypeptidase [Actinomycetota bacterium]|nr:murein DD-endopeptidase / murein LD-carboxypeptidase [Actinomycetota bacterium]
MPRVPGVPRQATAPCKRDKSDEEVGITGSRLCLRFLKFLALGSLGAFILTVGNVASAHTFSNWHQERLHIKHRAKRELGAPFVYGGTTPKGFDCSGFTRWTFHNNGADLPHSAALQFKLGHRYGFKRIWKKKHLKKADLVFFNTSGSGVSHAGIYIGHGKFISATSSSGVHIDSVYDRYYWGRRFVGATRVPATRHYNLDGTVNNANGGLHNAA